MKKVASGIIFLLFVAAFFAYQYFSGKDYVYRFSETQIQEKISEKLPIQKSYFIIFGVNLNNPRVELRDGSNRVNAGLDITLNIKIGGESKPLGGTIDVSGGLLYSKKDSAFFLTDPIIENLGIQGVPEKYSEKAKDVLAKALGEYYSERPIYKLKAGDPAKTAAKLLLKRVVVEDKELVVVLGI